LVQSVWLIALKKNNKKVIKIKAINKKVIKAIATIEIISSIVRIKARTIDTNIKHK
jgi:hypothetical protein